MIVTKLDCRTHWDDPLWLGSLLVNEFRSRILRYLACVAHGASVIVWWYPDLTHLRGMV